MNTPGRPPGLPSSALEPFIADLSEGAETGVYLALLELIEEGLIITIGRMVTQKVIEQMASWKASGIPLKPVSINFSAVQIHDHLYKSFLMDLLALNGIDPSYIIIELTENIFLENKDTTIQLMKDLRAQGIQIAIDDCFEHLAS